MKSAALYIKNTASSIRSTSFYYLKYVIYMLVHKSYLFFYVVDEEKAAITVLRILNDGRAWMSIIKKLLRKNGTEKQNNCTLRQLINYGQLLFLCQDQRKEKFAGKNYHEKKLDDVSLQEKSYGNLFY